MVLLLDELILWLAGRIADLDFVRTEAQKLVKLVEAQHEDRPAPLASFIARQRDIADFVGPEVAGVERRSLWDALEHGSGRFEVITLEDTNLPAIVELRVVRPKDSASKTLLDQGFRDLQRSLPQPIWSVLLGEHGEEADFRKVYPFSPAVLEAMVALSDALQRERTAIRLLTELLVEHASDLVTGEMVVVGDLFDVVAGGEEPFDRVMKERFDRAKALYRDDLLPMIRADQGTATGARCQRLTDDHPVRLGCSGCAETACRNDNRLAKSLLLAALVPHAAPFRDLSVSRLVRLNHGAVPTPIPGTEVQMAADRLRRWAGQIGQLRVGDGSDPQVSLRLEGVDLAPILDGASEVDNPGNRRRKLQEILFEALGLDTQAGSIVQRTVEWRGTRRTGAVRYGNVREMRDEHLRCPGEAEWHVVIDYPFDDPGLVPDDDARRLEAFVDAQGDVDNPTFVWLPTFFSDQLSRELGRLVIIDHILAGDNARRHLGHLRPEDQARARQDLESLGNNKRAQLRRALDISYGLGRRQEGDGLDDTRAAEEPVISLQPGLEGRPLLQSTMGRALDELVERLLEHRCPHHPRFEELVNGPKLRKVLEHFEKVVAAPDHRVPLSSAELRLVRGIAEPLTLLTCSETSIQLRETLLRQIDQRRDQVGKDSPTVDDVRGWISPEGNMCLPDDVADLVVAAYAVWSGREPERMGVPVSLAELGRLPGDAQLIRPDLPSETEWKKAIELAGHLFGIAFPGRALNLGNLHDLDERVSAKALEFAAARKLPEILEDRVRHWCRQDGEPARVITARSGAGLLKHLDDTTAAVRVRRLAAFEPRTSPQALGKGLTASAIALAELQDTATWTLMDQVAALKTRPQWGGEASEITDHLAVLLGGDELVHPLKSGLQALTDRAAALLRKTREAIGQYSVVTDAYPSLDEALQDVATRAKGGFREPEQEYRVRIEATVTVDEQQDDDGA
ncbi:MAG TPA: hypothetical protein PLI95_06445 [Polyangiaceae bacterium]|nr:hypothetical protein [Polyangiaceae bacterium]